MNNFRKTRQLLSEKNDSEEYDDDEFDEGLVAIGRSVASGISKAIDSPVSKFTQASLLGKELVDLSKRKKKKEENENEDESLDEISAVKLARKIKSGDVPKSLGKQYARLKDILNRKSKTFRKKADIHFDDKSEKPKLKIGKKNVERSYKSKKNKGIKKRRSKTVMQLQKRKAQKVKKSVGMS